MKYRGDISSEEYAAMEDGYEQGFEAGRRSALAEALKAWQWGEWANAPRCKDVAEERLANAQFVTNWLRNRLESL